MEVTLCHAAGFIFMYGREWVHRVRCGLKEVSSSDSQHTNGLRTLTPSQWLHPCRRFQEDSAGGGKCNIWQNYSGGQKSPWTTETDQPVNSHHHPATKCGFKLKKIQRYYSSFGVFLSVKYSTQNSAASSNPQCNTCTCVKLQSLIVKEWKAQWCRFFNRSQHV